MWRKVCSIGALRHSVAGRNARSRPSCQPLPLPLPLPLPRGCSSSSGSGRVRGKMESFSGSKKTTFNHIPPLRPPPATSRSFFIISCCRFSSSTIVIDSKGDGGEDGLPVASSNSNYNNKNKIKHGTTTAKATAEATKHEGSSRDKETMTCEEAKRLMRLVNVEALKMKLSMEGKEVIPYSDLLDACKSMGLARSSDEAVAFARILDEAGVVLLFRDKVYLHPDKVVDLVKRAVPLALTPEDDPMRDELKRLQEKKEEIDVLAHKQVRRILWCGLGLAVVQVALFFRLTFWEFSWDVMEPIAFFVTATGIVVGYAYFLFTAKDPTYQDLMKRLFLSRQRKLFKKLNFDVQRFKELQSKCKTPLDATASIKNRVGVELELEDAIRKD